MPELKLSRYAFESRLRPSERTSRNRYHGRTIAGATFVYVVSCRGYVKIGIAGDVNTRVRSMQGGCPFPITVIFTKPIARRDDAMKAEIALMLALDDYHSSNDWFRCSRATAIYAAEKTLGG